MFDERDLIVGPLAGEQFALPQREGPVDLGKAQEFAMSHVGLGDFGNIRTVEFVQPDGSIARLRTRGGYPVFETDETATVTSLARGFVAKVPRGRAVLFNPYTLAVLNSKYTPAGKHYTVQDFATSWNVPASDTTHWHDVVLADGGVKINAKTYSPFGSFGTLSETSIPHIINRADDYDQYGNTELNLTQKRYFEVERESVKTWGGAGSVSLLTPQDPITDAIRRAMTVGPRVDFPTDTAWLAEFYSSSVVWDDPGASWLYSTASVQMLLTSAYLVKVSSTANVDMPVASLANAGSSTFDGVFDVSLPAAEVCLIGIGELGTTMPYVHGSNYGFYRVNFPWRDVLMMSVSGEKYGSVSRQTYSGTAELEQSQVGEMISYSASNTKVWDSRSEQLRVKGPVYLPLPATHDGTTIHTSLSATATEILAIDIGDIPPTRGRTNIWVGDQAIPGSYVVRAYEEQLCEITVSIPYAELVSLTFSRNKSNGNDATPIPVTGYYAVDLASPYGSIGNVSGMGVYSSYYTDAYVSPASDICPINDVYKQINPPGTQAPEATTEINAKYTEISNAFAAQTLYDNENSNGYPIHDLYSGATIADKSLDESALDWTTVDHLLCDELNGVFVTVEGNFSGSQSSAGDGLATLTITLKVKTRHDTSVQTLEVFTIPYWELLIERDIGSGKRAVPSPQIRAIFTPLYREQGSFKGAHYVTQAEELAGAVPFHGFNFRLRLTSYDAVGSVNTLNDGETVYLVPCNLLEMLYAFVFSQEYGVAEDGTRYPVTNIWNYNLIMNSLFTNAYRVSVRDGVAGNWTDAFGTDFAETSTISLHRT